MSFKVKILGAGSIGNHLAHASRKMGWCVDIYDIDANALVRTKEEIYPGRYGEWDKTINLYGSKENLNINTLDFLNEVNDFGVSRLIYTDINRDGTKSGPNFNESIKISEISKCPVVISGGVSSINDIKKAKNLNINNIEGIIVGKAIYDGDIKLEELAKEVNV